MPPGLGDPGGFRLSTISRVSRARHPSNDHTPGDRTAGDQPVPVGDTLVSHVGPYAPSVSIDDAVNDRRALLEPLVLPWRTVPAVVYDRHLTVWIVNDLARAVHPVFRPGVNLVRSAFLPTRGDVPAGTRVDAAAATPVGERLVAELRRSLEDNHEDRGYVELVGELAAQSAAFAQFWAGVGGSDPSGVLGFEIPALGHVDLAYHRFAVPGPDGDTLLLWRGADDASAARLASLAWGQPA